MNNQQSETRKTDLGKPRISEPPLKPKAFLKYLGPAFIFTAAQIGGGELVTVPLLGAYFGMVGLFLVPIIAFIKVFGQYYLVQYGVVRGKTFLSTCWEKNWLKWLFFLLMLGCVFHSMLLAGLLGNTAGTSNFLLPLGVNLWIIIIMALGFVIVFTKSYGLLEKTATILLWIFLALIVIVAALFWPTWDQWSVALTFQLPGGVEGLETTNTIETIAVVFVVLGAGFGPTVAYIWYAKDKKMGMFEIEERIEPEDLTEEEIDRLDGWKRVILYQNLVSAGILTIFSTMIWIAAAQTLYINDIRPQGWDMIAQMVNIFTLTYGEWSGILFIICGMLALFSSIIGPLYGFARLFEESFEMFGVYKKFKISQDTVYRICLVFFTSLPMLFIFITGNPMWLFSIASMLTGPILGALYIIPIIVIYIEMKDKAPKLKPRRYWAVALAVFSGAMMLILSLLGLG